MLQMGFVKLTIKEKGDGKIEYWDGQENLFSKELQPILKTDKAYALLPHPILRPVFSCRLTHPVPGRDEAGH